MKIVKMNDSHVSQVAQLEKLCFADPWSEKSIASELTNPLSYWLVAVEVDTVAGYIGSQSVMGESDMMNVAVAPEHRRRGVGEALVSALAEVLKEQGNESLALEVRASNTPARELYRTLGFTETGVRKNYYTSPREDAVLMMRPHGTEEILSC